MGTKIVREGTVSVIYPERHSARVIFEDYDNVVSAELPVLTNYAGANKSYHMPSVGELVVCLMAENSGANTTGFIIGSRYNERLIPVVGDENITRIDFSDSAYISYDRREHELRINFSDGAYIAHRSDGSLIIENKGNIIMDGRQIKLN